MNISHLTTMNIPHLSWKIEPTETVGSPIYVASTTDGRFLVQATTLSELGHRMDSALEGYATICEEVGIEPLWKNAL